MHEESTPNKISHIDDRRVAHNNDQGKCTTCISNPSELCYFTTRKKFIEKCLPFNNFDETKKNILNFDKTSYIYYNTANTLTYYLDKNFILHKYKSSLAPQFKHNNILTEEILITVFNIDNIKIPSYYLFCNYTHIFNIFIGYYKACLNNNKTVNIKKQAQIEELEKEYNTINSIIQNIKTPYNNIELENKQLYQYINKNENTIIKNLNLKKLQINDITKKNIDIQNKKLKDNINIYKKKIDNNKHQLKLIINELKQNTDYTHNEELLKKILEQKKELEKSIEKSIKEESIFKKTITNIFQIDDNNNFIKLSYKFNIFNISLLCEKYFDIIKLLFNNKISLENIKIIFKDFSLVNIYYLIIYKKNIKQIYNDRNFMNFMNSKFGSGNNDNVNNDNNDNVNNVDSSNKDIYNNIINIEHHMNNITEINIADIYKELYLQLEYIYMILNKISIYIPNYKMLFLMAIISYRNTNNLINNTWGFLNKKYITDFIKNNTILLYDSTASTILKKYYKPELPILYEYDSVTYKNVNYGNCMENTIFQFLKVIFWNKEINNYDFNKIKEIINDNNYNFINNLFININNEKTLQFINTWVEFITELPNINNNIHGSYDFNQPELKIEINPSLNNLIIALKYLIKWTNNLDNNIFMIDLISKINKDYKVNIKSENKIDKIELIFNEKKYIIKLNYALHASFEGIDDIYLLNLIKPDHLTNPTTLIDYINNSSLLFSSLNEYIIYLFLSKKKDITTHFIKTIDKNIISDIIDNYINFFRKKNSFMIYLIYYYKIILEKEQITTIYNNIILNILNSNDKNKLLSSLDKNIIVEFSTEQIVVILQFPVINNPEFIQIFISKLIEYEMYKTFDNNLWLEIINFQHTIKKFLKIIDDSIISKWDLSVWIGIFYYYHNRLNNDNNLKIQIEKLIRNKFNSKIANTIEISNLIKLIINIIPESEWSIIFINIKSLDPPNIFNYIIEIIKNKKLYNMWKNTDTFNNYFVMINNISKKKHFKYANIDKLINISSYSEILTQSNPKNINWGHLGYLLKILRDNHAVDF